MTTISALIPTHNRREVVLRAIDSVLSQTVPVDEVIVIDDGSTDGTAEMIGSRYGSRVVVIQQENAGVSAARNRGIREARGEWIAFLDSDDVWLPTKIERQLEALAALGDGFGACFTDCVYDGDPNKKASVFQETGFEEVRKFGPLEQPARYVAAGREPFFLPSLMVLRSLLEGNDGFDESMVAGEDTDLMFRLCFRTRFCFVGERLIRIDRTPCRTEALSDIFGASRDDRKFDNLARQYAKWLKMPEVAGTEYEEPILKMLRLVCYDSAECKIHQLRIGPALREIGRLRKTGAGYPMIAATLFRRKIAKLRRGRARTPQVPVRQAIL
jgi:glycosyltransferase involved in cell wall biosynthesis